MKLKITRTLQLTFADSKNRRFTEVLKNTRTDLTAEAVQTVMESMVKYDVARRDGTFRYAEAISAKIVEKRVETLFEIPQEEQPKVVPIVPDQETAVAAPRPRKERVRHDPVEECEELTLSDMARYSGDTVAAIMERDFRADYGRYRIHRNSNLLDIKERYLSNALKAQMVNTLLAPGKRIDTRLFKPFIKSFYKPTQQWTRFMAAQLENISAFIDPTEWTEILTAAQTKARQFAAESFGSEEAPDYQKADAYLKKLLAEAKAESADYEAKKLGFSDMLKQLVVS